jgi:hypothetical protein
MKREDIRIMRHIYNYLIRAPDCYGSSLGSNPVAILLVTAMGDIVDFGIGLSYWPASLFSLAVRYDNLMP